MYDTFLFDLDGTLLNTLTDLSASVNHALRAHHLPERTSEEVRAFLGNGIRNLIARSLPTDAPQESLEPVLHTFRAHYLCHSLDTTAPYPGITSLLDRLKARHAQMGIISNKVHAAVEALNARFFAPYMDLAFGETPTRRRKPAPDALLQAIEQLGARPERTLFVGDSEIDHAAAHAAGLPCALVLWGFRDAPLLHSLGADHYLSTPADLLPLAS